MAAIFKIFLILLFNISFGNLCYSQGLKLFFEFETNKGITTVDNRFEPYSIHPFKYSDYSRFPWKFTHKNFGLGLTYNIKKLNIVNTLSLGEISLSYQYSVSGYFPTSSTDSVYGIVVSGSDRGYNIVKSSNLIFSKWPQLFNTEVGIGFTTTYLRPIPEGYSSFIKEEVYKFNNGDSIYHNLSHNVRSKLGVGLKLQVAKPLKIKGKERLTFCFYYDQGLIPIIDQKLFFTGSSRISTIKTITSRGSSYGFALRIPLWVKL
jgi:hypothetical protein